MAQLMIDPCYEHHDAIFNYRFPFDMAALDWPAGESNTLILQAAGAFLAMPRALQLCPPP